MKRTAFIVLFLVIFAYPILAECSMVQIGSIASIYDTISPEGKDAFCNVSISLDGVYVTKQQMQTFDGIIYNASISSLENDKNYYAYIYCSKGGTNFYSDCNFNLKEDIFTTRTDTLSNSANLNFRYYFEVNKSNEIRLYDNTSQKNAYIVLDSVFYQMNNNSNYFYLSFTNPIRQDVQFYVNETDLTNLTLSYSSGIMRFRIPFYVDFYIYKSSKNENNSKPYNNQFQYIILKQNNVYNASDFSYLNSWANNINWLTGTKPKKIDDSLSLWGVYENGKARIKMYESGNYSLNLETTKSRSSILWNYEFIYPQETGSEYYNEIASIGINAESNQIIKVYASLWDISKTKVITNWVLIVILILIYLVLLGIAFAMGQIYIIGAVLFGGGFILMLIIKSILG